MKNITVHTGELTIIERLNNSASGNPRYLVIVDGWTCRTKPDASYNYDIPNLNGRAVRAEIGTYYGRATIENIRRVELQDLWRAEL